jgi:hypothetical protein
LVQPLLVLLKHVSSWATGLSCIENCFRRRGGWLARSTCDDADIYETITAFLAIWQHIGSMADVSAGKDRVPAATQQQKAAAAAWMHRMV